MVKEPSFEIKQPPDLNSSRNHNALLSAKLNQVRLDGELHNLAAFAFATDIVNARHEFTKGPGYLRKSCFHDPKSK
jgi:hypothetical protein